MSFTIRHITETYFNPDGSTASGHVLFWPSSVMRNGGTTAPSRVRADLDAFGVMSVLLCANDDSGTSPDNVYYFVEEVIKGAPARRFAMEVPSAGSGSIGLSTLSTIETPPQLTWPATGPAGPAGPTGATGPTGPAGSGVTDHGALTGLTDDDHAQYYNQTRGDARYSQLGHAHTASNVSDFSEAVDDRVATLIVAGTNVTKTYDDTAGTLTLNSTGGSGGYATVQDEGTGLTARSVLNLIGPGVSAADNSGSTRTDVTIPGVEAAPLIHTISASGSALTLDASSSSGSTKFVTLTANCTFTLTGTTSGRATSLELILKQDGTGGRTVTWPAAVKWDGGPPLLSTAANAIDKVLLTSYDNGTTWLGEFVGRGYA